MTGILFYKLFNKNTFLKCQTDFIRGYYARIDKICVYHEGIQGAKSTKKYWASQTWHGTALTCAALLYCPE